MNKDTRNKITLVVPGLMDAIQLREQSSLSETGLPVLQLVLSKSGRQAIPVHSVEDTLLSLFPAKTAQARPSIASICAKADLGETGGAIWLRVDPVHLVADKDGLILHGAGMLAVSQYEADTLVSMLNSMYGDKGWEFHAPHPHRWYLRVPEMPSVNFSPLAQVTGMNIREFLPTGDEAAGWNAVLSEIQMMFHSSEINQQRNQAGKPAINSVWIWGEGDTECGFTSPWDSVMADDPLTQGLCRLSGTGHVYPLKDFLTHLPVFSGATIQVCRGEILIVLGDMTEKCNVMPAQDCLREFQDKYLKPVFNMIKQGRIHSVSLYPCNGDVYHFRKSSLWKFWKPRRALSYFLSANTMR